MAPAPIATGWTTGRIIALAAGPVLLLNANASPGLSVRAEAGISALALPWLAGEMLATGLLTGVAAVVLIVVPVRLASRRFR